MQDTPFIPSQQDENLCVATLVETSLLQHNSDGQISQVHSDEAQCAPPAITTMSTSNSLVMYEKETRFSSSRQPLSVRKAADTELSLPELFDFDHHSSLYARRTPVPATQPSLSSLSLPFIPSEDIDCAFSTRESRNLLPLPAGAQAPVSPGQYRQNHSTFFESRNDSQAVDINQLQHCVSIDTWDAEYEFSDKTAANFSKSRHDKLHSIVPFLRLETQIERREISPSRHTDSIELSPQGIHKNCFSASTEAPPLPTLPQIDHYRKALPLVSSGSNSPGSILRRLADDTTTITSVSGSTTGVNLDLFFQGDGECQQDEVDENQNSFIHLSLLSYLAFQLEKRVPRNTYFKGNVQYEQTFTGKDIVSAIHARIQRELIITHGLLITDRRASLQVARSLQSQLFFTEVEWDDSAKVKDNAGDLYNFLDNAMSFDDEFDDDLPTGIVTILTRCYSPTCSESDPCYSYVCPRKGDLAAVLARAPEELEAIIPRTWEANVGSEVMHHLSETEIRRQNVIHNFIEKEEHYVHSLDIVEENFIIPLKTTKPSVVRSGLDEFIDDVFGVLLSLRECNRRLVEAMHIRRREGESVIRTIGDIVFEAVIDFMSPYPAYIGHHLIAERRLKDEIDNNPYFRIFLEECSRQSSRSGDVPRLDLKHFLNRPIEYLQKLPGSLEAILGLTDPHNTDYEALKATIQTVKSLQSTAQLITFQCSMMRNIPGKWEWHDLVSSEVRATITTGEVKRQAAMFELIQGEIAYVKDLGNIDNMYIVPLRTSVPPIIPRDRLEVFIEDVFHNYKHLYEHHNELVKALLSIQEDQHPIIGSIIEPLMHAVLQFKQAYQKYIPNYPLAAHKIDDEMRNNSAFKKFVESCIRHPDAHRLDMKNFINRPIPRLLRYELLLKAILEQTPEGSADLERIPATIHLIKSLGKETESGVFAAKQKVDLWRLEANFVFKPGETVDMELSDPNRTLLHSGKLLRQPDGGLERKGWTELFVLLLDNYLVLAKSKEKDSLVTYHINQKPVPLDLLTLVNAAEPPLLRSTRFLGGLRGDRNTDDLFEPGATPDTPNDSRFIYPLTLYYSGRNRGTYILYAESSRARLKWKQKLDDAFALRKIAQESNKVFELRTLSAATFVSSPLTATTTFPARNQDNAFIRKVTCSVPFSTSDGRSFVAIGCSEGVWIGLRQNPSSARQVLPIKMVTQCAMLQDFGIFLVLADGSLFAYHLETLVPTHVHNARGQSVHVTAQKINGRTDVHFFSVGTVRGRTLVIYMKKKGSDNIFVALEPIEDKIKELVPVGFNARLGFRPTKSEWFRVYKDFVGPSEPFDLFFLKTHVVILCAKGFETIDLNNPEPKPILDLSDARTPLAKRCEAARAVGIFRVTDYEYLLCYDEFGLYVDKHGIPTRRSQVIEWEGIAVRAALHAPHIMLFDATSQFIEIRDVAAGRLVQIIHGNDIRCTWDRRGTSNRAIPPGPGEIEAHVHAVLNTQVLSTGTSRSQGIVEYVVELPLIPSHTKTPMVGPGPLETEQQDQQPSSIEPPMTPLSVTPVLSPVESVNLGPGLLVTNQQDPRDLTTEPLIAFRRATPTLSPTKEVKLRPGPLTTEHLHQDPKLPTPYRISPRPLPPIPRKTAHADSTSPLAVPPSTTD
ncbi:Rho1 guanine nucleotide exchange factor 1 [Termitomyces sp. T112]|nr:Rho1 guanine nucleotide exchange factor 1 [Termitomyces sp. T112]